MIDQLEIPGTPTPVRVGYVYFVEVREGQTTWASRRPTIAAALWWAFQCVLHASGPVAVESITITREPSR